MKKKINNYRFQQQQKAKIIYQKVKKVKETIKEPLKDATEELEYVKKLLSGEDVGNFGPEEPIVIEDTISTYWSSTKSLSYMSTLPPQISKLSLSEILNMTSPLPIKRRRK